MRPDDEYYDSIAEGYEELHKEEQLNKLRFISKHFKVKKTDKLLDVGCGTGITKEYWKCKTYGIDPAKKLLEKAKGKNYFLATAENIPFDDNSFDVVTSITAIQNFYDIKKGLSEIKRVGKRRFILSALKKSPKINIIREEINKLFDVKEELEEEKDIVWIIE